MRPFHEIITERRRELGLTVEQVHERLERSLVAAGKKPPAVVSVGHWFNGTRKRPRDMDHLKALCDALDMQLGEAMGEEPTQAATGIEQLILKKARGLSTADQEMLLAFMDRLKTGR